MSTIQDAWKRERLEYQKRYVKYLKESAEDPKALGHLLECSYVLIRIFGLTVRQIEELEQPDSCGMTKKDWEEDGRMGQRLDAF